VSAASVCLRGTAVREQRPGTVAWGMRARRAGNAAGRPARSRRTRKRRGGPPWARRGWQRRYRCLPRAQPGLAPRAPDTPKPFVRPGTVLERPSAGGRKDEL